MVQRRDLNAPPAQQMAHIVQQLRDRAQASKTGAAGVKDLGETGDVIWPGTDGEQKSVKRFQVELDDTTERAQELADAIAAAEATIAAARDRLDETERELGLLDTRVTDVDETAAKRVSRGPVPPRGAPLGSQWLTPAGHRYVAIPCEEVPDGV